MATKTVVRQASGFVAPGFERIGELFSDRLAEKSGGAGLSIHLDGRSMASLWGGNSRSTEEGGEWTENTLVNLWSISKTLNALCVLHLVDQKQLSLDTPVCSYWPEFAANGKAEITIRQVLCHKSGVPGVSQKLETLDMCNSRKVAECLQNETPWWPPGTKQGVHVQLYGHLLGEVVRRVTGMSMGAFWHTKLAGAFGPDVFIGVPESEHKRIADVIEFSPVEKSAYLSDPTSMLYRAVANPPFAFEPEILNSAVWWKSEMCGYATAEGVARVYDLFALVNSDRPRILPKALLLEAMRVHADGWDEVLGKEKRWCLGLQAFGTSGWIGMAGLGGSFAAVHPEVGATFSFLANAMADFRDALVLLNALSQLLGTPPL